MQEDLLGPIGWMKRNLSRIPFPRLAVLLASLLAFTGGTPVDNPARMNPTSYDLSQAVTLAHYAQAAYCGDKVGGVGR